jgi:microcystin-dependent protein
MMGLASAKVSQITMNTLGSSKVVSQAQHYANSKAELIEGLPYTELASQTKTNIAGSSFYEEVIVGNETAMPGDTNIKQKTCVVNVYEGSETTPRASLTFKRYSVSSGSSVPAGSIIPWYGNLANIPDGFALCDGKNGTPDLRNRFLVGAGDTYKLSDIGGEDAVKLEPSQTSSHYHTFGYHNSNNNGYFITTASKKTNASLPSGTYPAKWNGSGGGGWYGWDGSGWAGGQNLVTSLTVATEAQKPHENRPPYYALYYLMKLE